MKKRIFKIVFNCLCLAGIAWFTMPVLHGGFKEGSIFGVGVCGLGIALAVWCPRWAARSGWRRVCAWAMGVCYALGLAWAG